MKANSTFLNLSSERQKEIVDVAFLEFTGNDYQNASLSAIVKALGLAKGSFYRYFNSKKDLYIYLIDYASKIRYQEIDELSDNLPESLEDLLIENFRNKIEYDKKFPLYSGFLYRVLIEKDNKELGEITLEIKNMVMEKTLYILQKYANYGKLKKTINLNAMAFTIMQVQIGIYEYLSLKYDIDFIKNIQEGKPVFNTKNQEVMDVVKDFAKILTHGINQ
jgi:TetR/AcrR family transcriptional regulator